MAAGRHRKKNSCWRTVLKLDTIVGGMHMIYLTSFSMLASSHWELNSGKSNLAVERQI